MAEIIINEISQNYTYNVGANSYCCVALPITSSWGPGLIDPDTAGVELAELLEDAKWTRYAATQSGLESFVSAYRGPAANYRLAKDYSYQMALTLLTAGYDVLVCRLAPGAKAEASFTTQDGKTFTMKAKYPGTFGNQLMCTLQKVPNRSWWNLITYVVDTTGVKTAVENITFAFEIENSTDSILHIDEIESSFLDFTLSNELKDTVSFTASSITLEGGTDRGVQGEASDMIDKAAELATMRYESQNCDSKQYLAALNQLKESADTSKAATLLYKEWLYTYAAEALDLLKDKLAYNHNRLILPGWDDQDIKEITGQDIKRLDALSPLHVKLMDVAYYSRCATAYIDIPKSLPRSGVYNSDPDETVEGYAQKLSRYLPANADLDVNGSLYSTHSALFAPWGQYKFAGTSKQNIASPSFLALMMQRSMIKNQSVQYEWLLPSSRKHSINVGKLAYGTPQKILDEWQTTEGVGVNVLTQVPDIGTTLWGDSTLYEVPAATYQALRNLSSRLLYNAVKDVVYRVGTSIQFTYRNSQAKSSFHAGVSPLLDTMKNQGAIEDYYIKICDDIDLDGQIKANSLIGKVYICLPGVLNDLTVDLIALPPSTDLTQYYDN